MVICPFHYRLFFGSHLHAIEPKKLKKQTCNTRQSLVQSPKRQNNILRITKCKTLQAK